VTDTAADSPSDIPGDPLPAEALIDAKRALRADAAARRKAAAAALPPAKAGAAAAERFLRTVPLAAGAVISGYWPLADEIDPRPILRRLAAAGHVIGLPVVTARATPLTFRRWHPDADLVVGSFKVMTPGPDAAEVVPDVVLAPLLAFDRAGYRLGYGGGFYDRTLEKLRRGRPVLAVGLAYASQELPAVPREPTDQRLDWLVTERAAVRPAEGRPA
jgi:5-formyltetrahydrofolate cyclo-ligase